MIKVFEEAVKGVISCLNPELQIPLHIRIADLSPIMDIQSLRHFHLRKLTRIIGFVKSVTDVYTMMSIPEITTVLMNVTLCSKCNFGIGPGVLINRFQSINLRGTRNFFLRIDEDRPCPDCETHSLIRNIEQTGTDCCQIIKVQESPVKGQTSQHPNSIDAILLGDLCDVYTVGDHIDITGIYSIYNGIIPSIPSNLLQGTPIFATNYIAKLDAAAAAEHLTALLEANNAAGVELHLSESSTSSDEVPNQQRARDIQAEARRYISERSSTSSDEGPNQQRARNTPAFPCLFPPKELLEFVRQYVALQRNNDENHENDDEDGAEEEDIPTTSRSEALEREANFLANNATSQEPGPSGTLFCRLDLGERSNVAGRTTPPRQPPGDLSSDGAGSSSILTVGDRSGSSRRLIQSSVSSDESSAKKLRKRSCRKAYYNSSDSEFEPNRKMKSRPLKMSSRDEISRSSSSDKENRIKKRRKRSRDKRFDRKKLEKRKKHKTKQSKERDSKRNKSKSHRRCNETSSGSSS